MNSNPIDPPGGGDLQFDRADFKGDAAIKCVSCQTPISGQYFQANGQTICPACRERIVTFGDSGSGAGRLLRAIAAGMLAAGGGFLLYWAILAISGWEVGLIAIVVGWLVGNAVRWGSHRSGGLLYQLVAIALTYISICAAYVPSIIASLADTIPSIIVRILVAIPFSWMVPWMGGFQNILGWIIIGIGLYQAWVMNKKLELQITGPYSTSPSNPGVTP